MKSFQTTSPVLVSIVPCDCLLVWVALASLRIVPASRTIMWKQSRSATKPSIAAGSLSRGSVYSHTWCHACAECFSVSRMLSDLCKDVLYLSVLSKGWSRPASSWMASCTKGGWPLHITLTMSRSIVAFGSLARGRWRDVNYMIDVYRSSHQADEPFTGRPIHCSPHNNSATIAHRLSFPRITPTVETDTRQNTNTMVGRKACPLCDSTPGRCPARKSKSKYQRSKDNSENYNSKLETT